MRTRPRRAAAPGFVLIEALIRLAVTGLLAVLLVAFAGHVAAGQAREEVRAIARGLGGAVLGYRHGHERWPTDEDLPIPLTGAIPGRYVTTVHVRDGGTLEVALAGPWTRVLLRAARLRLVPGAPAPGGPRWECFITPPAPARVPVCPDGWLP